MDPAAGRRPIGALFLLAALFAAGLWFVVGGEGSDQPVVRGATAPDFSLSPPKDAAAPDASEAAAEPVSLSGLHRRVVLVNFWATWCEPCEREMPAMERLWERLPRDGFELVAVSIDDEDAKVVDFVKRYALRFPVVMDRGKQVSVRYQTTGVPESILVDREGHVVERYVGPRDWDAPEYVARIEALIGSSSAPSDGAGDSRGERDADAAGGRPPAPSGERAEARP